MLRYKQWFFRKGYEKVFDFKGLNSIYRVIGSSDICKHCSHLMPPILFFFSWYTCFRGREEEEETEGRLLEVKTRLIRAFAHSAL